MSAVAWILVACCTVFLIVWMALTFTNQFCTGTVGFGLCYNSADDPACPVCGAAPSPMVQAPSPMVRAPSPMVPAPSPMVQAASPSHPCPAGQTSCYMPEPYSK